nr:MAG TPA: deoxyribosyltransferase [Caudoviricetes sp.]
MRGEHMGVNKYNSEGYLDLTAYEAVQTVDKEIRDGQRRRYPKIYICSPFRGDTEVNTQNAISYCRFAVKQGYFPIAPHIWLTRFLDDADRNERDLGISFGLRLLSGCREVWVFGSRISDGMGKEIKEAERRSIPVRYFSEQCEEMTP